MKAVIDGLVVVEGKRDSAQLKRFFQVDTKETQGAYLSKSLLKELKEEKRRVIILTDPDSRGQKIREKITREVPHCYHAFIRAKDARQGAKVGVEYASQAVLFEALKQAITYQNKPNTLTMKDMLAFQLCMSPQAKNNREKLSSRYHLGDCNAKTLLKRLNALAVSKEEIRGTLRHEQ